MKSFYDHQQRSDNVVSGQHVAPIKSSAQQTANHLHRSHLSRTIDTSQLGSATHISFSAHELLSFPRPPNEDVAIGNEVDTMNCHNIGLQLAGSLKRSVVTAFHSGATAAMIGDESENWLFDEIYRNMRQYVHGMVWDKSQTRSLM